jgi:tetratricopeptide (TPR) repeat protein
LPSTRPDFGGRRSIGAGAAAGAIGAGVANRASLPGLGDRRTAANRPLQDRRQELSNRLTGEGRPGQLPARDWGQVRQDWQDNRDQVRQDWQDHRDQARGDWQNWFDDHYPGYGGWYWGHAPAYWNRWDYLWDNYPVASAVGLTWWGANTLGSSFGCGDYYNPYYEEGQAVSYAQPVVSVPVEVEAAASEQPQPPGVSQEALDKFDRARLAFQQGDYEKSLQLINETVRLLPHDAVVHEFRALVLFALKRYTESATALHAVLAVGPGWDAKTLTSLYPDMGSYTAQFRALEAARDQDPKKADVRFLLGYHYLTCGYPDEAAKEFRQAADLQPKNTVAASLAATLAPRDATPAAVSTEKDSPKPVPADEIAGAWAAAGKGDAKYSMNLEKDGAFTWSFARGSKKEGVKGVYTIEGNVLAMEPDTGGTLLAELTFQSPDGLHFKMIGGAKDDPGLDFLRASK